MSTPRAKLDDAITDMAVTLVVDLIHRARQQYGVTIENRLRDKLIDEIATAGVVLC